MRFLGPRPVTHRAVAVLLPTLLGVAAVLTGCGSDASSASDPASVSPSTTTVSPPVASSSGSPGSGATTPDPSPGAIESDQVAILSATAAWGQVGTGPAVALSDDAAVASFGSQLTSVDLVDRITRVVARTDVPVGRTLYGAVVAVGCDVPPGVVVTSSDEGVVITAQPVKASQVQCFAPVTSVALVLVTAP